VGTAALSILMPALTVALVVAPPPPGPEDACPSARQVGEAMQARFPGALIAADPAAGTSRPDALRSVLDVAGDGTVVRFALLDARGETQLRRTLPAPGRGRPIGECLALADTLAVIVERYLGGIAYDAGDTLLPAATPAVSAPPPGLAAAGQPGRGVLALVGLGWRMPRGAGGEQGEVEARVGAQVELTRTAPRLSVALSAGISPPAETEVGSGDSNRIVTVRRFPFRLGALLAVPAGPGWVEPTAELGADLFAVSSTKGRIAPAWQEMGLGFGLQAAVGYRLKIAGALYLRPRASIGIAVLRYDIEVQNAPDSLFTTPRGYASFGIDTGVLFR
jgi:hypothetical protein